MLGLARVPSRLFFLLLLLLPYHDNDTLDEPATSRPAVKTRGRREMSLPPLVPVASTPTPPWGVAVCARSGGARLLCPATRLPCADRQHPIGTGAFRSLPHDTFSSRCGVVTTLCTSASASHNLSSSPLCCPLYIEILLHHDFLFHDSFPHPPQSWSKQVRAGSPLHPLHPHFPLHPTSLNDHHRHITHRY